MSLYTMRALSEMMHPSGTINFLMTDSPWEKCASLPPPLPSLCLGQDARLSVSLSLHSGPIRTILGSHCNVQQPPKTDEEPEWMRLSTLVGAPAGSAIFRDHRVWCGRPTTCCALAESPGCCANI